MLGCTCGRRRLARGIPLCKKKKKIKDKTTTVRQSNRSMTLMSAAKPDVCCLHTILCVYRGCGFVFGVVVSAATFRCGSAAHLVLISFLKDATVLHCIARMHSTHTEGLTNERAGLKRRARVAFAFHPALFTVVYSNHPSVGFFLSSFPLSLFFFFLGGGRFFVKTGCVFTLYLHCTCGRMCVEYSMVSCTLFVRRGHA